MVLKQVQPVELAFFAIKIDTVKLIYSKKIITT